LPPIVLSRRGDFILALFKPSYSLLVGACVGSFLNVCLVRWKSGGQVLTPASHCPHCKNFIHWYDNIPIISFFILMGKCRFCKCSISWQYPLVEFSTSVLFLFSILKFSNTIMSISSCFFCGFLILLVTSDLKWRLLPLIFNNLLVVFGVFFSILNLSVDPFRALTGYVCAGGLFLLFDLIYPKGLGGGDVVMAAGLGVWLGASNVILALLIAFGMGALYSFPLFLFGKVSRKTMIPFGPFLALGALCVWFFPSLFLIFSKR
jgi:leader peptidase (prepilin peptidase)/N-methyltransferase